MLTASRYPRWEFMALFLAAMIMVAATWLLATDYLIKDAVAPPLKNGPTAIPLGKVIKATNNTLRERTGSEGFLPLHEGDAIYLNDTLMAGPSSELTVVLKQRPDAQEQTITLSENSLARINFDSSFVVDELDRESNADLNLDRGAQPNVPQIGVATTPSAGRRKIVAAKTASFLDDLFRTTARRGATKTQPSSELARPKESIVAAIPKVSEISRPISKKEILRISDIAPEALVRLPLMSKARVLEFPVFFSWNSSIDNVKFKVRLFPPNGTVETYTVPADGSKAAFKAVLRWPGTYTWTIEDPRGPILSSRRIQIDSMQRVLKLGEPEVIGQAVKKRIWTATDGWAYRFFWEPFHDIKTYKIKVDHMPAKSKTLKTVQQAVTHGPSFELDYRKELATGVVAVTVEGVHPNGFRVLSNSVTASFEFIPPMPKSPKHKARIDSTMLSEGSFTVSWHENSDAEDYTVEIAQDPHFRDVIYSERTGATTFRFYPSSGHYFWHVRCNRENASSPYSETHEFSLE